MLFSRRKLEAAVVEARAEARRQLELQAELKASGSCAGMPSLIKTSIIGYQLLWILGGLLLVAEGSAHLVHAPPPVVSLLDTKLALQGVHRRALRLSPREPEGAAASESATQGRKVRSWSECSLS